MEDHSIHQIYDPRLYAMIHHGSKGDLAFYCEICREAEAVLELGCGFGRLLLPLASAANEVTGLDFHEGMLATTLAKVEALPAELRQKIHTVQADMRAFSLSRRFDRILLPFNTLYCFLEDADILAIFARVREHLAPQGLFAFDVYHLDDTDLESYPDDFVDFLTKTKEGSRTTEVYERRLWDGKTGRMEVTYSYQILQAGKLVDQIEYCIPQRYLPLQKLRDLLTQAGFQILRLDGGFQAEAFDPLESEHRVLICSALATDAAST